MKQTLTNNLVRKEITVRIALKLLGPTTQTLALKNIAGPDFSFSVILATALD